MIRRSHCTDRRRSRDWSTKCLEKEPDRRYQSTSDTVSELAKLANPPVVRPSRSRRAGRLARRWWASRFFSSIRAFRSALDLDSRFFWSHLWIGQVKARQRQYAEAVVEIERALERTNRNTRVLATLGNAFGLAGRTADAQQILGELRARAKQEYVSAYYLALVYAGLGMRDRAFEHLDRAIEERQPYLILLNVEPPFLSLHSDARFQDVLRRIGIPTTP